MVTFRNNTNNRRNNFRRNDRGFKSNGDRPKYRTNFSNNENFQRKVPGRNNHNASKLIEKYNDLARDAITSGDKILSENYFQHADHFTRILNEQESYKKSRFSSETSEVKKEDQTNDLKLEKKDEEVDEKIVSKKEDEIVAETKNKIAEVK
ncbi:DUF4167 domain-containing protein [Candidatus Pelagibacter sp.]|nr:DUF4167 domain-containing protein [Candidatus Pelagibacter sp.]